MTRGRVTVACNFGTVETAVPIPPERLGRILLTSGKAPAGTSTLPPESVTIWGA